MAYDGEHVRISHELLRDRGRARSVGLIVARENPERRPIDATRAIDLIHGEVDAATRHDAVALLPWAGGGYSI